MLERHKQAVASLTIFIRRKWRLILFAGLLLLAAELLAVRLWDEFYPVQPGSPDHSQSPITEAQKQSAVDLVRTSAIADQISGGQAWEVTEVREFPQIQQINIYVEWNDPVESSGPWLTNGAPKWLGRDCRSVRSRFRTSIRNIRFLRFSVSTKSSEIVRLWPFPPPQDISQHPEEQPQVGQGNFLGSYEIYNEKAGRSVFSGPMLLAVFVPGTCPRGERSD